jgi:hypothetical protein
MQCEPIHINRRSQQARVGTIRQYAERRICGHQLASCANDDRRIWFVAPEDELERLAGGLEYWRIQIRLGINRSVAGRDQELIAIAQLELERLSQADHECAPWHRPRAFDEAQVALRGAGPNRELELTQAAVDSPGPELAGKSIAICNAHSQAIADRGLNCHSLQGIAG